MSESSQAKVLTSSEQYPKAFFDVTPNIHTTMNLRIFLTTSSLLLLGWLTASYFSAQPVEGHLTQEQQPLPDQSEVVLAKHL